MIYTIQTSGIPIYRQIVDRVIHQVVSGTLESGTTMPSVRDVALKLTINPMTVSKAYSILVEQGFLVRLRGRQLAVVAGLGSTEMRTNLLKPYVDHVVEVTADLGLDRQTIIDLVRDGAVFSEPGPRFGGARIPTNKP